MKLTIDDPKLTAYALGELDAAERADIEARTGAVPGIAGRSRSHSPHRRTAKPRTGQRALPGIQTWRRARRRAPTVGRPVCHPNRLGEWSDRAATRRPVRRGGIGW